MVIEQFPTNAITKIWASNFRSIERMDLDLEPLTVLVGPNSSGKSNIVDVLRFFRDTARKGIEVSIAERGGLKYVQRIVFSGATPDTEIGLGYRDPNGSAEYSFCVGQGSGTGYRIRKERLSLEYSFGQGPCETLTVEIRDGRLAVSEFFHYPREGSQSGRPIEDVDAILSRWSIDDEFGEQDLVLLHNQSPVSSGFLPNAMRVRELYPEFPLLGRSLRAGYQSFLDHLNSMGFYRIFPDSLREPQRLQENKLLLEGGENLASTLQEMQRRENRFLPDLNQALNRASPGIQDVRVTEAGSYLVVELKDNSPDDDKRAIWFDLSHQSDGTLRLLGLLVALFQEPPPTLFAIEEPEMNIHPGGMAVLMDAIAEATQRGQVMITTHSRELLDLVPVDSIRAVSRENGVTKAGRLTGYQWQSILEGLFSVGELHSLEGLQAAATGE